MKEKEKPKKAVLTEMDEALDVARQDPAQANYFYDTFLNTEIFFPALNASQTKGDWKRLQDTEKFFPLYLTHEEARAIPVFDTLEKLKTWADTKAFDYLALQAHILLKVIAPEIAIVLNENTPHRYLFTPEILESLRQAMKPITTN